MFVIINHSFSIKKEDLFQTTARVFGFKRSGNKINQRLEVSFDYLLQSKKVIVNDEKIMIKKS
jgi:hypothetical protein